jgi:multidrug resistance efflux pump
MIRSLKKRPRSDNLVNEKRVSPHAAGRYIYLAALAIFGIAIANYLFGDFFFLRANGLVLKDHTVIAPSYVARIQEIRVKEGQQVKEGQILFTLQSLEMLERLADLSARRARLVADSVEFRIRSETVAALLPLAKKREDEAARVVGKFDELNQAGLTTASSYDTALTANFNAQQDHVKLATQLKSLERELSTLAEARTVSESTLMKLQDQYADGVVRAPVSGAIGVTVPSVGTVYKTADPILSIYSGEPYVLAYMPRRYLFSVSAGQKVIISDGQTSVKGVLMELLPITDALAKEFQNTFKPTDRSQLAKIKLVEEARFPLHQKVDISLRYF